MTEAKPDKLDRSPEKLEELFSGVVERSLNSWLAILDLRFSLEIAPKT